MNKTFAGEILGGFLAVAGWQQSRAREHAGMTVAGGEQAVGCLARVVGAFVRGCMGRSLTVAALLVAAITGGTPVPLLAQVAPPPGGYTSFGTGCTKLGTTNVYAVISQESANNGTPNVTYVNATSDTAATVVQFWQITNYVDCVSNNAQVLYFNGTNTATGNLNTNLLMTVNAVFCLHHVANDTYEYLTQSNVLIQGEIFTTNTYTTSAGVGGGTVTNTVITPQGYIGLRYAPVNAVQNGDRLYLCSPGGTIPVGSATVTVGPAGTVYSGQKGLPLMLSLTGTTTTSINSVSATYQ